MCLWRTFSSMCFGRIHLLYCAGVGVQVTARHAPAQGGGPGCADCRCEDRAAGCVSNASLGCTRPLAQQNCNEQLPRWQRRRRSSIVVDIGGTSGPGDVKTAASCPAQRKQCTLRLRSGPHWRQQQQSPSCASGSKQLYCSPSFVWELGLFLRDTSFPPHLIHMLPFTDLLLLRLRDLCPEQVRWRVRQHL